MRTALLLVGLSLAYAPSGGPPAAHLTAASRATEVIQMHRGVPGLVYLGQPLAEFLAKFPGAKSTPVSGQKEILRVQVDAEGISCLAMGKTPPTMTLESIGFNFGDPYEGVSKGKRRTVEGIGSGSTVNDLLGTYGRPDESTPEPRSGGPPLRRPRPDDPDTPMRHLYRSSDAAVTTYFVVQGHDVVRMAIARPAEIGKYLSRESAGGDAPDGGRGTSSRSLSEASGAGKPAAP